jgi:tetratricopeptide (TPR) repeat protein
MNTIRYSVLALLALLISPIGFAQNTQGDKAYARMAYKQAIGCYEQGLKKDSTNAAIWSKLGDCYRHVNDSRNAEIAFAKAIAGGQGSANDHYFYILALMQNQKYTPAKAAIDAFKTTHSGDSRIAMLNGSMSRLDDYLIKQGHYIVKAINQNGPVSDICAIPYKDGIVFISDRGLIGNKNLSLSRNLKK